MSDKGTCLSMHQPCASLLVTGVKPYVTFLPLKYVFCLSTECPVISWLLQRHSAQRTGSQILQWYHTVLDMHCVCKWSSVYHYKEKFIKHLVIQIHIFLWMASYFDKVLIKLCDLYWFTPPQICVVGLKTITF